jgi:ComF family protein
MKILEKGKIQKYFLEIKDGLIELLFPAKQLCPVCRQEESFRGSLGRNCLKRIVIIKEPVCEKCGRPERLEAKNLRICKQCAANSYYFTKARAVALYEGALREMLAELKYRYRPDLGEALGLLMVEWVKLHHEFQNFNIIIPVPINQQKLNLRGYNQAQLLASPLQKYLGINLNDDIIVREKITESQNKLDKEQRFVNIKGAFRVVDTKPLGGAKVLLIDDIFTTGATASEVSRALLRAGSLEVKVLTLAAGVIDTQWINIGREEKGWM